MLNYTFLDAWLLDLILNKVELKYLFSNNKFRHDYQNKSEDNVNYGYDTGSTANIHHITVIKACPYRLQV